MLTASCVHVHNTAGHSNEETKDTSYYNELKEQLKTQKHIQEQQRAKEHVRDREHAGIAAAAHAATKTLDAAATEDTDVKHSNKGDHSDRDSDHHNNDVHRAKANAAAAAFIDAHDAVHDHNGHHDAKHDENYEHDHGKDYEHEHNHGELT
jgi:hypothetical protein